MKSQPLHEQAADALRDMIIEGQLKPGQRMPERELCEILQISRTPLREAIKLLASEGFVRLTQNRGSRVTELDTSELTHTVAVLRILEAEAIKIACVDASDEEIKAINAVHSQMCLYSEANDDVRYFRANQLFHELIVQASHNPVLQGVHARLHTYLKRVRYQRMHTTGLQLRQTFLHEHGQIAEALTRRDMAAAAEAMSRHMQDVATMVNVEPKPSPARKSRSRAPQP